MALFRLFAGYLLIAASASQMAMIVLLFLHFKEFELVWGAVFFKIWSHIFMIFEVKSSDIGQAETGNGVQKRVDLRREFFLL